MRKFSIFRYVKQFSLVIFLLAVVGSLIIFHYGQSQQRYIASVVIRYANKAAQEGFTPDGSPLNVDEIYSSTVIDAALRDLGYEANIDSIRSNCYVEEIIPESKKRLMDVLLDKGEETSYTADTYRVYFVAGSDMSENYAWNVLDAIIKNYCEFYTEKYVEERLQNNGAAALTTGEYDYIESAQVLEDAVSEMLDYILTKRESWPYFRSVETGYTYSDLNNIYNFLYNYEIPNLYATILNCSQTSDIEVLINRLTKDSEDLELAIRNQQQQADHLRVLIDNYSNRNKEMMDYHYHTNAEQIGTDYILKDVEEQRESTNKETTYDGLIQEYVNLNIGIRNRTIERNHNMYLLSVFQNALRSQERNTFSPEEIQSKIDHCSELVSKYYQYVEETGRELNRHLSADYLTMVSSINVTPAVNLKLYVVIAVVLFTLVGVLGAVLLGRLLDFIDYFLYVDKTVGLPNRAKCDEYIAEQSERLLSENYACLVVRMTSLNDLSRDYGRATGDAVLKDFGQILKSFGDLYGFIGHNGAGNFMSFFPECSSKKLNVILEAISRQVEEYNKLNKGHEIRYVYGRAVSDDDNCFEIRGLLRMAMQRMNMTRPQNAAKEPPKVSPAEEEKKGLPKENPVGEGKKEFPKENAVAEEKKELPKENSAVEEKKELPKENSDGEEKKELSKEKPAGEEG